MFFCSFIKYEGNVALEIIYFPASCIKTFFRCLVPSLTMLILSLVENSDLSSVNINK